MQQQEAGLGFGVLGLKDITVACSPPAAELTGPGDGYLCLELPRNAYALLVGEAPAFVSRLLQSVLSNCNSSKQA